MDFTRIVTLVSDFLVLAANICCIVMLVRLGRACKRAFKAQAEVNADQVEINAGQAMVNAAQVKYGHTQTNVNVQVSRRLRQLGGEFEDIDPPAGSIQ